MPADRHLNQLEFEGMPARASSLRTSEVSPSAPSFEYGPHGAHMGSDWGREDPLDSPNPLYRDDAEDLLYESHYFPGPEGTPPTTVREEFIPPWRAMSDQGNVNMDAVRHQVEHANPLRLDEDPQVYPVKDGSEEHYFVPDGNHRTLAAQFRGQLLMPAQVERYT